MIYLDLVVWPSGEKSIADSFLLATGGNDNLVKVWNVTHVRGKKSYKSMLLY